MLNLEFSATTDMCVSEDRKYIYTSHFAVALLATRRSIATSATRALVNNIERIDCDTAAWQRVQLFHASMISQ